MLESYHFPLQKVEQCILWQDKSGLLIIRIHMILFLFKVGEREKKSKTLTHQKKLSKSHSNHNSRNAVYQFHRFFERRPHLLLYYFSVLLQ